MRALLFTLLALGLVTAPAAGVQDKGQEKGKGGQEKLIGVWEAVKGDLPAGSTVEFTKDGKLKLTIKAADKSQTIEGSYKVDADKIMLTMKQDGKEHKETLRIKTLSDKELVTIDEKGMQDEFKRKK